MTRSLIEPATIELRGALAASPVLRVRGYRLGAWAAHDAPGLAGRWALSLLPLGTCLPTDWALFARLADALGALRAVACMRNDWHRVTQADFDARLKARLMDICRRHRAVPRGPVGFCAPADTDFYGRRAGRLNGYAAMGETAWPG